MIPKPKHLGMEYAEQFKDSNIAEAYRYRPPYPAEVFSILTDLISQELHPLEGDELAYCCSF
jgi:hypothetical protein